MNDIVLFDNSSPQQLPAYLQTGSINVNAGLLATIGAGGNRIGLKGSRFRLVVNGKEEKVFDENYLDVVVVGVVPHISRMYYEKEYQQGEENKAAPTCYSEDGNAPPADLEKKQSTKCDTCPMNVKGSKIVNGVKMKACGFFQRIVVMLAGDDSGMLYKLDVKSQGLFGDSKPTANKYNLRDYAKMLANRGADVGKIATRISFDTDSSVPKLLFQAHRFVTQEEFVQVAALVGSPEVDALLKISMNTIDLSGETAEDTETAPVRSGAAPTPQQEPVGTAPAAVKEQEVPKPQTAAPVPPEKRQYKPVPEKLGGFTVQQYLAEGWTAEALVAEGYIIDVTPAPEPAKPAAPAKPAGPPKPPAAATAPAKPAGPPKPTQAAPVVAQNVPRPATNAPAPMEVSSDAELDSLIGSLV